MQSAGRGMFDKAVVLTILSRGWQGLAGLISISVIARALSATHQGFYFTFLSLMSLQVFAELGMSMVLAQFASHERAFLEWRGAHLEGEGRHKERLSSLTRLTVKWYASVSLAVVLILVPAGLLFFAAREGAHQGVSWRLPWILAVLFLSGNIFIAPFQSILEGCGRVADVAKTRLVQDLLANLCLWGALAGGMELYAIPVLQAVRLAVVGTWMGTGWRRAFFRDLTGAPISPENRLKWSEEIFPFQWRIGLSWMSGYFIFQLFNPVLFTYHGAVVAGQMGLTLSAFGGIGTISMAWINTKVPYFGQCIARREFSELDASFRRLVITSLTVVTVATTLFVATVVAMQSAGHPFGMRFLPPFPLVCLALVTVVNHLIFAQAAYLRAHKQEPFLVNSVVFGILMALSTFICGKWFGAPGVSSGYLLLTALVGMPWASFIFFSKRRTWHHAS